VPSAHWIAVDAAASSRLTPLWPEQAPDFVFASEYVPSLHSKVDPGGGVVEDAVFAALLAALAAFAATLAIVFAAVWAAFAAELAAFATAFIAFATALLALALELALLALLLALPPQAARASAIERQIVKKNPVFIIFLAADTSTFTPLHRGLFFQFY
jgi:hypothetical protein